MRKRKSFERQEGIKSGRLVVIAAEGKDTENIYFEEMKASMHASGVHVEVLRRGTMNPVQKRYIDRYKALLVNMILMKTISYGLLLIETSGRRKCYLRLL